MSEETVITVNAVGKSYRIWESPAARLSTAIWQGLGKRIPFASGLRENLQRRAATGYRDFFALQDVSLEVRRGESVAIIGRNGSGKSTLLQIIAGTLQPSSGTVSVRGRIAAQLELGAGFNPEFTGRENVYLSGAVLGLNRAAMDERFDDIAAFADIGDFIDEPVKTYSSGMMTRLAFAVSTCVEPEILIIDEALSVGDAPFQAKCFRRLRALIDNGVSLLFVSHDLGTIRSVCSRAMWLKDGQIAAWGEAKPVAREYEKFCWQEQGIPFGDEKSAAVSPPEPISGSGAGRTDQPAGSIDQLLAQGAPEFARRAADAGRIGTGTARFVSCVLASTAGEPLQHVTFEQEATWHILILAQEDLDTDVVLGLAVFDVKGNRIAGVQNVHENIRLQMVAGESIKASIRMKFPFTAEKYSARLTLLGYQDGDRTVNGVYDFNRSIVIDQVTDAQFFEVDLHQPFPIGPAVCLPSEIKMENSARP